MNNVLLVTWTKKFTFICQEKSFDTSRALSKKFLKEPTDQIDQARTPDKTLKPAYQLV